LDEEAPEAHRQKTGEKGENKQHGHPDDKFYDELVSDLNREADLVAAHEEPAENPEKRGNEITLVPFGHFIQAA